MIAVVLAIESKANASAGLPKDAAGASLVGNARGRDQPWRPPAVLLREHNLRLAAGIVSANMPDFPYHASPRVEASTLSTERIVEYDLGASDHGNLPPTSLLSPAFTPPETPGLHTPATGHAPRSIPVDTSDLLAHQRPKLVEELPEVKCVVRARIPTTTGSEMFLHMYQNSIDNKEHLAIVFGSDIRSTSLDAVLPGETELDRMIRGAYVGRLYPGRTSSKIEGQEASDFHVPEQALVRIHSECYTGETAWSARCDCGEQLDEAARLMSQAHGGVIVYLRQEGRGIGLGEKLKAYNLQDLGKDTVEANLMLRHPADARSYGLATAILLDLGLGGEKGIRLLTNNPDKIVAVEGPNREIVVKERVPMVPLSWRTGGKQGIHSDEIEGYLRTKIGKMGHLLS